MSEQIAGTTPNAETQTGQQAAQQTQQQQTPNTAQTHTAQAQPSVEELAKQVEAYKQQLEVAQNSARYHQSQADKLRTGVLAATGTQQPVDPLAEDVKFFTDDGYPEADARKMAAFVDRKMKPVITRLESANATIRATTQVDAVLQAAYVSEPELLSIPEIAEYARKELQAAALAGQGGYITPEYAIACAAQAWAEKNKPWKQSAQIQQPAPQTIRGPQTIGFLPGQQGFTPAGQPATPTISPEVAALTKQMADYMNIPKKP